MKRRSERIVRITRMPALLLGHSGGVRSRLSLCIAAITVTATCIGMAAEASRPVKVFILAGDENCLEQGVVPGTTDGSEAVLYPDVTPTQGERTRHVRCAVYKGAYVAGTDYDTLTPEVVGVVGLGDQPLKRREPPLSPLPELALQAGYTTVLRGAIAVPQPGQYAVRPGSGESAFNVTTLEGKEVYRLDVGQTAPVIAPVQLEARKRYAFTTVFFAKPDTNFLVPAVSRPGTLETVMAENPRYAFLRGANGKWVKRDDVVVYDAHPIFNETRAPGRALGIPEDPKDPRYGVSPDLTLGHVLGDRHEEPVFLLRFATRHPTWFLRGSRSLGHDYLPPSSGGGPELQGSWDVIHFNWGVWDATYRDASSKYFSGHTTTSVVDFEKNLRTLVARMKRTGATLIWASVTPVWKGAQDKPNGDVVAFNAVAAKVMHENGVIIDDLNALIPAGTGSWVSQNVHDVGNLAPKVTEAIRAALASRKVNTKPLPRVLLIGDSITGSYQEAVMKNLDGEAAVFKNPGNAEDTWNGLERIEQWLDLRQYLQCGQEYLELVNAVKDTLAQFGRFCPGYRNQGVELAGLLWMQGIADSGSPSQTAAYEKNLANLIRDLRKDLNVPNLPVVVAALKMGDGKVHAAQLALGDAAKYPEFAGNVRSVDTQPFFRGGDPRTFGGNAETLLEVGDALGRAMLEFKDPN